MADQEEAGTAGAGAGPRAGAAGDTPPLSPLVAACLGQQPEVTPVWFMRQAGRSLPEYRQARAGTAMLQACLTPPLAAALTLQPVTRHGVDAAVLFSDIVVPLKIAGLNVEIVAGKGPVMAGPIESASQIAALPDPDSGDFTPVSEAARLAVRELGQTPLIGFAGAPFTLASYLVEGGPSRDLLRTKAMMFADPAAWHALASWAARASAAFIRAQVAGGASVVQVFDSWAGNLSLRDYREYCQQHSAALLAAVGDAGVPAIHFAAAARHLLTPMREAGGEVMGIDHRADLAEAIDALENRIPVQGNIDPALLFAPREVLHARTAQILQAGRGAPGHILNLGHGVPPSADPGVLTELVQFAHEWRAGKEEAT